jgi:hypothetical protein
LKRNVRTTIIFASIAHGFFLPYMARARKLASARYGREEETLRVAP